MQNANDFIATRENYDLVNDAFCVAVSLQFIAELLSTDFPNIALVETRISGYNSYLTLNIPADTDLQKLADSYFDVSSADDCEKINETTYRFSVDFPGLNETLDCPFDVDTF